MECSLLLGKRTPKRPLTELYVNGSFTVDRGAWERGLQRHCDEVYVDPEETIEKQEKGLRSTKHFTEDGRVTEITIDLVLQAIAKMAENKVNWQEYSIAREMIK